MVSRIIALAAVLALAPTFSIAQPVPPPGAMTPAPTTPAPITTTTGAPPSQVPAEPALVAPEAPVVSQPAPSPPAPEGSPAPSPAPAPEPAAETPVPSTAAQAPSVPPAATTAPPVAAAPAVKSQPAFDARPFLLAMLNLKREALTCDPYVNNSPAAHTEAIDQFFAGLKQSMPTDLVDAKTKASLDRFVKQQAASICLVRLRHAFADYGQQAALYARGKPANWPAPPVIPQLPWCSQADCSDVN